MAEGPSATPGIMRPAPEPISATPSRRRSSARPAEGAGSIIDLMGMGLLASLSLDHLICAGKERGRDGEPERLDCLEVDDQRHFRELPDRQGGRLLATDNSAGVDPDLSGSFCKAAAVTHQASGRDEIAILGDCGHRMANGQCGELLAPTDEQYIRRDHEPASPQSI